MRLIVGSPRLRLLTSAIVLAALIAPGCADNPNPNTGPNTTLGGKVSYEAGRVLEGVHAVQQATAAGAALPTGAIPVAIAGKIMIGAYHAGDAGEKLADIAEAYDIATAAGNVADQDRLAKEIQNLLVLIEKAFSTDGETTLERDAPKIAQLITNVMSTVNAVRKLVPQLQQFVRPITPTGTKVVPDAAAA